MYHHFSGEFTFANNKQHIPHAFTVPESCRQLEILFDFSPAQVGDLHNMLTLTLFDPGGFRGAGHRHGHRHQIVISPTEATPGYAPGSLPPGEWLIQIDTHLILPGEACRYSLEISTVSGTFPAYPWSADRRISEKNNRPVVNPRPGWYRGDLHAHSHHSDAAWSPVELVEQARQIGWDFVTLVDHNTVTSIPEMLTLTDDSLLTLVGMELTTFWGHALCLGTRHWVDWRITPSHSMANVARQVIAENQLFVIAHPRDPGDPHCNGCNWQYPDVMPGPARIVEVWNHLSPKGSTQSALDLWYRWLNQGYRMVATTGSDAHTFTHLAPESPCNVVYAAALSETAIFQAIRLGHLYLSRGPRLEFTARAAQSAPVIMGDALPAPAAEFAVNWTRCPAGAKLCVIANGRPFCEIPIKKEGEFFWQMSAAQGQWCLVEIRDKDNKLLAITNPIYLNGDDREDKK